MASAPSSGWARGSPGVKRGHDRVDHRRHQQYHRQPVSTPTDCSSSTDRRSSFHKWNWWVSGNYGDTAFTTFYPINVQKKIQNFGRWRRRRELHGGRGFLERRDELPPRRGQSSPSATTRSGFSRTASRRGPSTNTGTPLGGTINQTTGVWSVTNPATVPARRLSVPGGQSAGAR